jgi:hypothetical protein
MVPALEPHSARVDRSEPATHVGSLSSAIAGGGLNPGGQRLVGLRVDVRRRVGMPYRPPFDAVDCTAGSTPSLPTRGSTKPQRRANDC